MERKPTREPWSPSERFEALRIGDDTFAAAYEAVSATDRGRLKGLIAALYAVSPPRRSLRTTRCLAHDSGVCFRETLEPRSTAVVLLDRGFVSSAKLLAALLPAMTAGVGRVVVLRVDRGPFPESLLTALELAGVEDVYAASPSQAGDLLAECVVRAPDSLVLCFGPQATALAQATPLVRWDAVPGWEAARFGLCAAFDSEAETKIDAALQLLHPGCTVERLGDEGFTAEAAQRCDALIVAEADLERAAAHHRLVFSASYAGFWLWPELDHALCLRRNLALGGAS